MNLEYANPDLFAALSSAQGEIENANKNAANPHFKSRYADLAEVLNTIRPVFCKHGLSLTQETAFDGTLVSVTTLIAHKAGGYLTTVSSCQPGKSDAQGIGSATTYLRRYSAAAAAGISQEDDDGNAAAHNKPLINAYMPKISEEQYLELLNNCENTGRDPNKIAALLKIDTLANLPADAFDSVKARLISVAKKVSA